MLYEYEYFIGQIHNKKKEKIRLKDTTNLFTFKEKFFLNVIANLPLIMKLLNRSFYKYKTKKFL